MYLYYDTPEQWNYAYDNSLSCKEKVSVLKGDNEENNQIVKLTDKKVVEWYKDSHTSMPVQFAFMTANLYKNFFRPTDHVNSSTKCTTAMAVEYLSMFDRQTYLYYINVIDPRASAGGTSQLATATAPSACAPRIA